MKLRDLIRVLLKPAEDPLRDNFGLSIVRVRELRLRLDGQLRELRSRTGRLEDPAFQAQIGELQKEHDRLIRVEQRVTGELDSTQARKDLLNARQTAAQAQEHLQDLVIALDDAHARAAAMAEICDGSP